MPPGIKLIRVDAHNGMRAGPGDPKVILEAFKPGTAPPDNYSVIGADIDERRADVAGRARRRQCRAHRDRRPVLSAVFVMPQPCVHRARPIDIGSAWIASIMRAEITAIVEDIKQSLGLLRRHL